jgi:hypothetical protein
MRLLFFGFVFSLLVLVWTILAVRRHIRDHDKRDSEPLRLDKSNEDPLKNAE